MGWINIRRLIHETKNEINIHIYLGKTSQIAEELRIIISIMLLVGILGAMKFNILENCIFV